MSDEAVEFYRRMKEAQHAKDVAEVDLAIAMKLVKHQRLRIEGLDNTVDSAIEHLRAGDFTAALGALQLAVETRRKKR